MSPITELAMLAGIFAGQCLTMAANRQLSRQVADFERTERARLHRVVVHDPNRGHR
ncbi:hypothetical protein [Sphingomonas hengshuiensis]|uniref:hypothetical protein n=1 Tax=Sphingomonas hengshuiensis TaxID=1609977 RepID=UPI0012B72372|nr:hypothetical protein [Sphingomonas hengshuiensis]